MFTLKKKLRDSVREKLIDKGLQQAVASLLAAYVPKASIADRALLHATIIDQLVAINTRKAT